MTLSVCSKAKESHLATKPLACSLNELGALDLGLTAIWGTPSRVYLVLEHLAGVRIEMLEEAQINFDTLIVVGGGTRIDAAKLWRAEQRRDLRLIAIPSIWGSGAEASRIVVQTAEHKKEILAGDQYLPDIRCVIPELMASLPEETARFACGDAWSHALEGFLSPLADESVRRELADLMQAMSKLPLAKHADWFELSARACQGQAKSSVGLIHGIAHTLEGPLQIAQADYGWGHARLCSLFLYPVAQYNRQASARFETLLAEHGLDPNVLMNKMHDLFSKKDYDRALQLLKTHWAQVVRDPCTRTNSALVRSQSLSFFIDQALP